MSERQQPTLHDEVVRDLVSVSVKQLEVRTQELELQEKENVRQHAYAREALSLQARDRSEIRTYKRKRNIDRYIFAASLFVLMSFFIGYLVYTGKEDLAKEIMKTGGAFLAGGLSGYGVSQSRAKRDSYAGDQDLPEEAS